VTHLVHGEQVGSGLEQTAHSNPLSGLLNGPLQSSNCTRILASSMSLNWQLPFFTGWYLSKWPQPRHSGTRVQACGLTTPLQWPGPTDFDPPVQLQPESSGPSPSGSTKPRQPLLPPPTSVETSIAWQMLPQESTLLTPLHSSTSSRPNSLPHRDATGPCANFQQRLHQKSFP